MQFFFSLLLAALLALPVIAQDRESRNAHVQSTDIRQVRPAFHSPYEGPQPVPGPGALPAFPDGELAKTSGRELKVHRARPFVRHAFELGGDDVAVDSDANPPKSTCPSRRLVVTAGNVSVPDLFDASARVAQRDDLQRGALIASLVDATLRYGRERLAEVYYPAEFGAGFPRTADARSAAKPGDSKDRGPASFRALRLHGEV